jgi:predicted aminopeptidase
MIPFLKPLAAMASLLLLGGCASLNYYSQAIHGHMDVMHRAQPIDQVLADPGADDTLKIKLGEVTRIRSFASQELGLPDNDSYRRYADLQRPYEVWNVFAAPELSVLPKEWCYPLLGCASYRGYFSQGMAEAAALDLRQGGYDTYVGGIPAYSTLGWFDDPVLNTFVHYPETQLAALIFHELAHQLVYVPGDTLFNESFAAAVALAGTRRWLSWSGNEDQLAAFETAEKRRQAFVALADTTRTQLAEIYAASITDDEKRERKAAAFHTMRADYLHLKSSWNGFAGYDRWFGQPLNNAQLASVTLYTQMVPAFQQLLAQEDGDLPRFYHAVREVGALPESERHAALQRLAEASGTALHAAEPADSLPTTVSVNR